MPPGEVRVHCAGGYRTSRPDADRRPHARAEFEAGHIPGAVNVPLDELKASLDGS